MPRPRRQPLLRGRQLTPMPGPESASVSVSSGFADDMLIGDLNNDGEDGDAAFAMSQNDAVTVVLLNGPLLGVPVSYAVGIGSAQESRRGRPRR
ncbi:MAG: hypothetical protein R3F19_31290 [Verrucomicrobiales bacterium]